MVDVHQAEVNWSQVKEVASGPYILYSQLGICLKPYNTVSRFNIYEILIP